MSLVPWARVSLNSPFHRRPTINSKLRKQTAEHIRVMGRTLIGVFDPDKNEPPFVYTIGNHLKHMPELICVNIQMSQASILNIASKLQLERGKPLIHDEIISLGLGARFPVKFRDVTNPVTKHEFTIQAGEYLRTQGYEVRQLVMPDKSGRFPGDPLCAEPYASQILLPAV